MTAPAVRLALETKPARFAVAAFACIAGLVGLHLVNRAGISALEAFDLGDPTRQERLSLASIVTGFALAMAATLAMTIGSSSPAGFARRAWTAQAVVLSVLAADEMFGLHVWAESSGVLSWETGYLPLVIVLGVLWAATTIAMRGQPRAQAWLGAGAVAWLVSPEFDFAKPGAGAPVVGELLEMAGSVFLVTGLLEYLQGQAPAREASRNPGQAGVDLVTWPDPVWAAKLIAAIVLAFGALGALQMRAGGLAIFDLNTEQTIPALFSGLVLMWGASLAFAGYREWGDRSRWWLALGCVLLFLGTDEILAIHEEFQGRTGHWGQLSLMPVVMVGAAAWAAVLRRLWPNRLPALLFAAGAGAWITSQAIDLLLNEPFRWTVVPEEMLEVSGSTLFCLGLLVALRPLVGSAPGAVEGTHADAAGLAPARSGAPASG
jgi:hypothetical protein